MTFYYWDFRFSVAFRLVVMTGWMFQVWVNFQFILCPGVFSRFQFEPFDLRISQTKISAFDAG